MDQSIAQQRLVKAVRAVAPKHMREINQGKHKTKEIDKPDFLWHRLLVSFATMGRATGAKGLIENQSNYRLVKYAALNQLSPPRRKRRVYETCRKAKVRMPPTKTRFITECFEQIQTMGGPQKAKQLLLSQPDRDAKIKFLKTLSGIGPKYARNIMMDVYHKEFRDSIALDSRINAISKNLGLSFPKSCSGYAAHEAFYVKAAHKAGLNGWELDRLLFNFGDEVQQEIAR